MKKLLLLVILLFIISLSYNNECVASENNAQFVSQNVPTKMFAGQSYQVSIIMRNIGSTTWTAENEYRLGSQNPQDNLQWGMGRVGLASNDYIGPIGTNTKTFEFTVTAPKTPGLYNFQWRMVQEFIEWFGEPTQNVIITVEELPNYPDSSSIMQTIKTKGCILPGLLSGIEDYNNYLALLKRSNCGYVHRAIETWNSPPNFGDIQTNMGKVTNVNPNLIYGMFIAESIDTTQLYYYSDETRHFDFSAMCSEGTQGAFGPNTCKPSFNKGEYRKYLRYITRKAIDLGIQSFLFGQIFFQDDNLASNPIADDIVTEIKTYAALKGKPVVIGAQTNDISTDYLKIFDYTEGGLYQDVEGNIEEGACLSTVTNYCQALIWNSKYSAAKNRIVGLDWCCADDDIHRFAKLSREKRAAFLKEKYNYFKSRDIGFLMTFRGILNTGSPGGNCYGYNQYVYSPDNLYSCKDEDITNFLLSQKSCSSEGEICGTIVGIDCCEGLTCQLDGTNSNALGKCIKTMNKCTDSDGGVNYYIKGSTKLSDGSGLNDECTGDYTAMTPGILLEAVCDGNSQKHITYVCPYGCKDGACISIEDCTTVPFVDADGDGCHAGTDSDCGGIEGVDDPSVSCFNNKDDDCDGMIDNVDNDLSCNLKCGDGICGWYERIGSSRYSCPLDCGEYSHCWNGVQDGDEEGIDCGGSCNPCSVLSCNKDGVCEIKQGENSNNCPEDCYCGDGICDTMEDSKGCLKDCRYCTSEWECHLEPATCPEEGIQNKVCVDIKCGTEDKRTEALKCIPGTCSGCLSDTICYPVTTRALVGGIPRYCDITKQFVKQKDLGAPCQNSYECMSNDCGDGECISLKKELEETQSLLQRILEWLSKIFS